MEIGYPRVAAIDVGKKLVAVAVRTPGEEPGQRQLRKFKTFYPVLRQLVGWLAAQGVTQVAMEATGVDWRPVLHALCEAEQLEVVLAGARHVKNVPGRKTTPRTPNGWRSCARWAAAWRFHPPGRDRRGRGVDPLPQEADRGAHQ